MTNEGESHKTGRCDGAATAVEVQVAEVMPRLPLAVVCTFLKLSTRPGSILVAISP